MTPVLSAPLLGGRVLELAPDGRHWRLSMVQIYGRDRMQCGGFPLTRQEWDVVMPVLQAMYAYVKQED